MYHISAGQSLRGLMALICAAACACALSLGAIMSTPSVAQASHGNDQHACARDVHQTPKDASGIALDSAHFSDFSFRSALWKFDKDGNGVLSKGEIACVTKLSLANRGIKTLKGIGYFTNLRTLDCSGNRLKSVNVTKNTKLTSLSFSRNCLKSLNVSKNRKLVNLYCSSNRLTKLNVSKLTQLKRLNCSNNKLKSLSVSKNKKLKELACQHNKIKSLNVSKNKKLSVLDCFGNKIKGVHVRSKKCLVSVDRKVKVKGAKAHHEGHKK